MTDQEIQHQCEVKTTNGKRILTIAGALALLVLTLALGYVIVMTPENFDKVDVISGMVVMAIKDLFSFYFQGAKDQ